MCICLGKYLRSIHAAAVTTIIGCPAPSLVTAATVAKQLHLVCLTVGLDLAYMILNT